MSQIPASLMTRLQQAKQTHLVGWFSELTEDAQSGLLQQLSDIDFVAVHRMWQESVSENSASSEGIDRAETAAAPRHVVRQPITEQDHQRWAEAANAGNQLLSAGKVAVVTVAGGQGTRLGFEHPKGMFPVGPVTDRTLFQIFAEQIRARQSRHQATILWMIMTSDATHRETVDYFRRSEWFGLSPENVCFFQQGSLPAVDARTGQILMSDCGTLCLSPDGHGGLIAAMQKSGLLQRLIDSGVEHVFYHQVDNPTVVMCNPALLGFHLLHQSQVTTSVVEKVSPTERMGVLVSLGDRTEIIEYSELTPEQAARKDRSGQWIFWAGNTAVHVFSVDFLCRLTQDGGLLPLHVARKNVPHLNESGILITPTDSSKPNGIKFERFIFDSLPLADRTLIVEGNRADEFNPVKNRDGADSPVTAAAALSRLAQKWLRAAGVPVDDHDIVEISPLQGLDAQDVAERIQRGEHPEICRRK